MISADLLYNLKTGSKIQTLDTMLIFLGISLISLNVKNSSISTWVNSVYIFLPFFFYFFYCVCSAFLFQSEHLRITTAIMQQPIPSVYFLQAWLIDKMDSITTFHAYGIENIYIKLTLDALDSIQCSYNKTVLAYNIKHPKQQAQHD